MAGRREPGGIRELRALIRQHRGAFEYDWRTRFHLPLDVVGRSMSYGEGHRLTRELASDPSSHVAAAIAGWDYATSHEWMAMVGLREAFVRANFKDPERWPVPWASGPAREGAVDPDGPVLTQEQIDQQLREMAGRADPPVPDQTTDPEPDQASLPRGESSARGLFAKA